MINRTEKKVAILNRLLLFSMVIAIIACNSNGRKNDLIQCAYRSDFYMPRAKITNLRGKVNSAYFPGGKMIVICFRFESDEPIKIRERENYRKINPIAVLDFMSKKLAMDKEDIEFLTANKSSLSCLFFEKKFPADSSASASNARIVTIKKWIILWPKGKIYFGIHVKNTKYTFLK